MKRALFLILLAAVVGLFVFAVTREQTLTSPLVGGPAPAFDMPLYAADSTVALSDYAGKPVVLNFWASWCVSCRDEARVLEAGWRVHGPDVAFLGVAVNDEPNAARAFIGRYGKTYILGDDADGSVAIDYGLFGVPETFFIGPDGRILSKHIGPISTQELEKRIADLESGVVTEAGGDPATLTPLDQGAR